MEPESTFFGVRFLDGRCRRLAGPVCAPSLKFLKGAGEQGVDGTHGNFEPFGYLPIFQRFEAKQKNGLLARCKRGEHAGELVMRFYGVAFEGTVGYEFVAEVDLSQDAGLAMVFKGETARDNQ